MKVTYLVILIIVIIIAGGIYYIKTDDFSDFVRQIETTKEDNDFGGQTITKTGTNSKLIKEYPKDVLPIINDAKVTYYELALDQEKRVVQGEVKMYIESKSYEEIVKYYENFYKTFEGYEGKERPKAFEKEVFKEFDIKCTQSVRDIKAKISGPGTLYKNRYEIEIIYGK